MYLPTGATITYESTVILNSMPPAFLEWWKDIGGQSAMAPNTFGHRGEPEQLPVVWYQGGRKSHKMAGSQGYMLRFNKEDAKIAVMILLGFSELVISHNIKELVDD